MKFGSLFSGIGGLDLAMEACGHDAIWQVEMDIFCNRILKTHWPDLRRYTDIRDIDWTTVAQPELLCGGFPCQPFSVAGQNRGEDDERNLWPETLRAIRGLGPRYVFLENVPGLLAHEYFGTILGDLAEGGYDAVWDTFTAAEVGAPHRRERLFILAYARHDEPYERGEPTVRSTRSARSQPTSQGIGVANPGREPQQLLEWGEGYEPSGGSVPVGHPEGDARARRPEAARRAGQALPRRSGATVADAESPNRRSGESDVQSAARLGRRGLGSDIEAVAVTESERPPELFGYSGIEGQPGLEHSHFPPGPDDRDAWARVLAEVPEVEPAVCRVATGVPDRTHRLRALGNAVVPAQGAYAFRTLWERMIEERR